MTNDGGADENPLSLRSGLIQLAEARLEFQTALRQVELGESFSLGDLECRFDELEALLDDLRVILIRWQHQPETASGPQAAENQSPAAAHK